MEGVSKTRAYQSWLAIKDLLPTRTGNMLQRLWAEVGELWARLQQQDVPWPCSAHLAR